MFSKFVIFMLCCFCISGKAFAVDSTPTGFYYPSGTSNLGNYAGWLASGCNGDSDYFSGEYHIGYDIQADEGNTVYPISEGVVVSVSVNGWGSGNKALMVRHQLSDGSYFLALYGHIQTSLVVNDPVFVNQSIGSIGYWSNGNHLHFGILPTTLFPLINWGRMFCVDWPSTNGFVDPIDWITSKYPYSESIVGYFGLDDWREPFSSEFLQEYNDSPLGDPWQNPDGGWTAYVHEQNGMLIQDFEGHNNGFDHPYTALIRDITGTEPRHVRLLKDGFWDVWMNYHGWINFGPPVTDEYPNSGRVMQTFRRYGTSPSEYENFYFRWEFGNQIEVLDQNYNLVNLSQLTVESSSSAKTFASSPSYGQSLNRGSPLGKQSGQSGGGATKTESKIKFNDQVVVATTSQPDGLYHSNAKVVDFGQPVNLVDQRDYDGFYAVLGGGVIPIDPFNMDGDIVIYVDTAPPGAEIVFDYWYITPDPGTVGEQLHVEGGISNIGGSSITIPEVRIELLNPNGTEFYSWSEYNVYLESGWAWSQWLYGNPYDVGNHTARFRLYIDGQWQTYSTQTVYVQSNPIHPVADFSASPISGHSPLTVQFNDQSTGGPTEWAWNFGDGGSSSSQNPSHTYSVPGTYSVVLAVSNSHGTDGESKLNYITVNETLVADFSANNTSISAGQLVRFTDLSTGGPTSWSWDFGDGTTLVTNDGARNHVYMASGVYTVTLTVSSTMGSDVESKVDYITVGESELSFTADVVSGSVPLVVNFAGAAPGSPGTWCWDFGDGSISIIDPDIPCTQFISHTYQEPGVYDVQLAVAYSGGETIHVIYENLITVVGSFAADVTEGLAPLTVQFTDQSGVDASSWSWDFGDGSTSSSHNPSHNYSSLGLYTVTFVAGSGPEVVTMTRVDYINVVDSVMGFAADVTYGLAPLTVNFTNFSLGSPVFWGWSFGDGGESIDQHPSHAYQNTGSYTVTLYAFYGSHTDTLVYEDYITVVDELLNADFSSDVTSGVGSLTVQFTDQSTGNPTGWTWNFGDGTTSEEQSPSHVYSSSGSYDVILAIYNPYQASSVVKENYIVVESVVSATTDAPNVFGLYANHPNPFNPQTTIRFFLPSSQRVKLCIYDVKGRPIATLVDEVLGQGQHSVIWRGRDGKGQVVSSGVYFYRLTTPNNSSIRKMLLLK